MTSVYRIVVLCSKRLYPVQKNKHISGYAPAIIVINHYSVRKLVLISPSRRGWKAEST